MAAQNVVKQGCRWQVGDGVSINVWNDRWLPHPTTFKITSPPCIFLPESAIVSALIDDTVGEWKHGLINAAFLPQDANKILSIPINKNRNRDRQVWAYTPKGSFTVNSAYKLALSLHSQNTTGSPSTSRDQSAF